MSEAYQYIDDGGALVIHPDPLECVWCGSNTGRLYQRTRAEDGAPYDVSHHGVQCEGCILEERTRWRAAKPLPEDEAYARQEEDRQRCRDAAEGFDER